MRRLPHPLCLTCGLHRVKGAHNKYCCAACVPRALRVANCRQGRRTYAYRRRSLAFKADLERIAGRPLTRGDLLAVFQTVYKRAYNSGFQAGKGAARRGDEALSLAAARDREAA